MKRLQLLLLLSVGAVVAAVISDYLGTQQARLRVRVAEPDKIASNLNSRAGGWRWSQSSGNDQTIEMTADAVQQTNDSLVLELEGIELRILHEGSNTFDRIETAKALFDSGSEKLYSDGDVLISLGLPLDPTAESSSRTKVRTSGLTFHSKTGTCWSDRYTEYEFDGGRGHSVGAFYDSAHRYFRMESGVYLERFAAQPGGAVVKIRAGKLVFHEDAQRIELDGGASIERGPEKLEAAEALVFLENGLVRRVEALEARVRREQPDRLVRFSSNQMEVALTPLLQTTERITGIGEVRMTSAGQSFDMEVTGGRADLHYVTPDGADQSLLRQTHVRERARIEVSTRRGEDPDLEELRRVEAEWIQLDMRENGEELKSLRTLSRGRIELLPLDPKRSRRQLAADRIHADYAPGNRMENLRATGRVELESFSQTPDQPVLRTWSGALEAHLSPASGELEQLKQWSEFRFEQGNRRGQSGEAEFNFNPDRIEMRNNSVVWDAGGRISAWKVALDEETGDYSAQGDVSSMFHEQGPSANAGESAGSLFSPSEPMFATASRMISHKESGLLEYFGQARIWQGENRVEAEEIRIHRSEGALSARGDVVSLLQEPGSGPQATATSIRVSAQSMHYSEADESARYEGGVELRRNQLTVKSSRLVARFRSGPGEDASSNSKLDHAIASGNVTVSETGAEGGQGRKGRGEVAEYQPALGRVHLRGRPAQVTDGTGGLTTGAELTYHLNDDRLLVSGRAGERAYTLRRRRE